MGFNSGFKGLSWGLFLRLVLKKNIHDSRKIAMVIMNIYFFFVKDGAKLPLTQSTDKSTMKLVSK